MLQSPERQRPGERHTSRKMAAGALAIYGILIVATVRIATGNQLSSNPAQRAPAVASLLADEAALSTPSVQRR